MAKHLSDFEIVKGLDEAASRYAQRFGGPVKVETGPGRYSIYGLDGGKLTNYSIYGLDGGKLTTATASDLVPGTKGRGPIGREARAEKRPPLQRTRPEGDGGLPDDAA